MRRAGRKIRSHLAAGVVKVHRRTHGKRFWISMVVIGAACVTLAVYIVLGLHEGTIHHIAVAVLAERLAGVHLGMGEE